MGENAQKNDNSNRRKQKMAWVNAGFKLSITSVDYGGDESTRSFALTSADHAAALVDALQVIGYYEAVTGMSTKSYSIADLFVNDAYALPATSSIQREVRAVITVYDETDPVKVHTVRIMGPKDNVFLAGPGPASEMVDFSNAAVQNFVNMYSTGGECYISDGEITKDNGWIAGYRQTIKNSRG